MDADRYRRVTEVFLALAELDPADRDVALDRACGDDADLRSRVAAMLSADSSNAAMESVAAAAESLTSQSEALPERLGDYRVIRELGVGGMGVVYEAEQDQPRRRVALKMIRPGLVDDRALRRFRSEAELLGRLHHPHVAQVFEAGTVPDGRPFIAMELVDGPHIADYVRAARPTTRQRVELLLQICDALDHAHHRGVVHRDLKPGNILVQGGERPVAKVLDFGIARLRGRHAQTLTEPGQIVGTLRYMSPEQALGDVESIDHRSDVYAIGVLAYELLTGDVPLEVDGLEVPAAVRVIAEVEPKKLGAIDATLRGDLETIVAKALEKEPARRYATAAALRLDLAHYLNDEPISARTPSRVYVARKFARRNKALVGGVLAVLSTSLVGATVSTILFFEREEQRRDAEQRGRALGLALQEANDNLERAQEAEERARFEADSATAAVDYVVSLFEGANPERSDSTPITALDLLERGSDDIREGFRDRPAIRARLLNVFGKVYTFLQRFDRARPILEDALVATAEVFGEDSAEYADTLERLAYVISQVDDISIAEEMQLQVLDLRARHLGQDNILYTDALNNLANTLMAKGDYAAAGEHLTRARDIRVRLLGADHVRVANVRHNLGVLFGYQGRYADSARELKATLDGFQRHHGERNWRTLATRTSLADVLRQSGRTDEALEFARAGYEGQREIFGESSRVAQLALRIYSLCLADAGQHEQAAEILGSMFDTLPDGADGGFDRGVVARMLAGSLSALQRNEEAEALYIESIELLSRFSREPQEVLTARHNLAVLYQETDRLEEALTIELEVLAQRESTLDASHPDIRGSVRNLAEIYRKQGRVDEERILRARLDSY